jgi:hypothetical protein
MRLIKCKFEKDISGIYILPLVGYSNIKEINRSVLVGYFGL